MMDIRTKRLQAAFEKSKMTQSDLCEKAGINKGAFSSYLSGRYFPKQKALKKLASALNVSIKYLMGIDDNPEIIPTLPDLSNLSTPAAHGIPILGTICAGDGVFCDESYEGIFFVDKSIKANYCLKVKGDSMSDAEIYDGDLAFIKKTYEYEDGHIYAIVHGAESSASLKKVYKSGEQLILTPCNSAYKPLIVDPDEVFLVGECIGVYRKVKGGKL